MYIYSVFDIAPTTHAVCATAEQENKNRRPSIRIKLYRAIENNLDFPICSGDGLARNRYANRAVKYIKPHAQQYTSGRIYARDLFEFRVGNQDLCCYRFRDLLFLSPMISEFLEYLAIMLTDKVFLAPYSSLASAAQDSVLGRLLPMIC